MNRSGRRGRSRRRAGPRGRLLRTLRRSHLLGREKATWHREIETRCRALSVLCTDHDSQLRLARLQVRLSNTDRGVVESALAELELATMLTHAGFQVALLPESQARTADFECLGTDRRFYVEVTAMLGKIDPRTDQGEPMEPEDDGEHFHPLATRILARIRQKAKQLVDYCAPVLLAITLPPADLTAPTQRMNRRDVEALDLKRLAGAASVTLAGLRHISAVLLSLWQVEPSQDRSGARLANVQIVERPRDRRHPRIRLLVFNPAARFPLGLSDVETLKRLL